MAPEMLRGKKYGPEVDIWQAGICLYTMLYGKPPFFADKLDLLKTGVFQCGKPLTPNCQKLLKLLLCADPAHRGTFSKIMNHPWLMGKDHFRYAKIFTEDEKDKMEIELTYNDHLN